MFYKIDIVIVKQLVTETNYAGTFMFYKKDIPIVKQLVTETNYAGTFMFYKIDIAIVIEYDLNKHMNYLFSSFTCRNIYVLQDWHSNLYTECHWGLHVN